MAVDGGTQRMGLVVVLRLGLRELKVKQLSAKFMILFSPKSRPSDRHFWCPEKSSNSYLL